MGVINIYDTLSNNHKTINANGKLRDILAEYKLQKTLVIKSGNRLDDNYNVTENDVLYCRTVPGDAVTIAIVTIAVVLTATAVAVGVSLYQQHEAEEKLKKAQRDAKNLADRVNTLAFLRGAKNRNALSQTIQYVMGETYNTPYMGTDGYYSLDGVDGKQQFWNAVLTCGYKGQIIKSMSIGNTVIKTWDDTTPQNSVYSTDSSSVYHNDNNLIEITQNGKFINNFFRQKIKGIYVGKEIKNDFDGVVDSKKEYVIQQCELYTNKIELCIEFDALRRYSTDSEQWEQREVTVTPEWSNDDGQTWNVFKFDVENGEIWHEASQSDIDRLVSEGKLKINYGMPKYEALSSDVRVRTDPNVAPYWWVSFKATDSSNIIVRNSKETIRFIATKEFTAEECFNKNILVRVSRSMKLENNSQEDCYFKFLNCYCYDNVKSTASNLVNCNVFENADKLTLIGVRFIADNNTRDILDEFNVISRATAHTITESGLGEVTHTRNAVAWLLDILTNDLHQHSKYNVDELDINSFYDAYDYCERNKLYIDGIVTSQTKKKDLLLKILEVINGAIIINTEGKLELLIDKEETTPVALLNQETIKSITYAKELNRKPDGIKLTFTNSDTWQIDNRIALIDETKPRDENTVLIEKAVEYVTDKDFIYKIGQRALRTQVLQPVTITADIGREGDYYPLYSLVLLQVQKFKQGLQSSVITKTTITNGNVTYITLSDAVQFDANKNYGVIIQTVTNNENVILYKKVGPTDDPRKLAIIEPFAENKPDIGNAVSFGELDANGDFIKVAEKYKIYGIKKSSDGGVSLTLKPYNPELYKYGIIPEFKSNLTPTPTTNNQLPTVTRNDINQVLDNIRVITNVVTFYALSPTEDVPPISEFKSNVPIMTSTNRYLWTFTRYEYKDGSSKSTDIVLTGVYGERGAPGSGYILDLSPDSTTIFANSNGSTTIESLQFGAYLFLDTVDYSAQTTFTAYIDDKEVGSWAGTVLTIPTSELIKDTTQIKIVATYESVTRTAYASVTKVYGNTSYQLLPSSQNIKVNSNGDINPPYVTITRQKINNNGYYQASEEEGVVYGRVIPGGKLTKIGYERVKDSEIYDSSKLYTVEFEPFMLGVSTMPGSGEDIVIGNEDNSAIIFYRHK